MAKWQRQIAEAHRLKDGPWPRRDTNRHHNRPASPCRPRLIIVIISIVVPPSSPLFSPTTQQTHLDLIPLPFRHK